MVDHPADPPLRRRGFLRGLAGCAAALSCGLGDEPPPARDEPAADEPPAVGAALPVAPEDRALLLAAADVIVPGGADHPPASAIDLAHRLERWIGQSARRAELWRSGFSHFAAGVRSALPADQTHDPAALYALFVRWHARYRQGRATPAARFFEQLRRDVLRVYYASPEGWRSLGYAGPPRLERPPGARGA